MTHETCRLKYCNALPVPVNSEIPFPIYVCLLLACVDCPSVPVHGHVSCQSNASRGPRCSGCLEWMQGPFFKSLVYRWTGIGSCREQNLAIDCGLKKATLIFPGWCWENMVWREVQENPRHQEDWSPSREQRNTPLASSISRSWLIFRWLVSVWLIQVPRDCDYLSSYFVFGVREKERCQLFAKLAKWMGRFSVLVIPWVIIRMAVAQHLHDVRGLHRTLHRATSYANFARMRQIHAGCARHIR
jgi:hypothetical protein